MNLRKIATFLVGLSLLALAGCGPSTSTTTTEEAAAPVPLSGEWDFQLSASTGMLAGENCPTQSGSFDSGGAAQLTVSADGNSAVLDIDGNTLNFSLTGPAFYETETHEFPVLDGEDNQIMGMVYYTMTATSETSIEGSVNWDNTVGCQGTYPFTLEWVQ